MTNRLDQVTRLPQRILLLGLACLAVAGCTALPEQAGGVQQMLDERTGITITRLGKPLEFTVTVPPGPAKDPFAYLSPFQTNRMGQRADFVWLAVPADGTLVEQPVVRVDGAAVRFGTMSPSPAVAELESGPYRAPAPWSQQFFVAADADTIAQLAGARRIEIATRDAGGEWSFVLEGDALSALTRYAETR
ncbi:MAG: hypothetical protein R3F58_18240 [Steroidobacteraceae bacterium]